MVLAEGPVQVLITTSNHTESEYSMWLSEWKSKLLGLIDDTSFFRSSMNGVERQLCILAPTSVVDKG
jgi:hypothetical protein